MRYVIKRGSVYTYIATEHLKFLDITSYLAAHVRYDSFLKAYNVYLTKSYFPYEYFDGLSKLDSTEFPAFEDIHSFLKGKNTLEPCKRDCLNAAETTIKRS